MQGDDANSNTTAAMDVLAVSVKIPTFVPSNPRWFFVFCESQFRLKGVTADETRYDHVACNLPPDVAARVMSLLQNPPDTNKYESLKQRLLKEYTLTDAERAATLLDLPGIGDMKPSQLYQKMIELLPPGDNHTASSFLLRELFLRQLPVDIRSHLADKSSLDLEQLAEEADKFFTSSGQRISAVQPSSRPRRPPAGKMCFYHERFGDQARRCRPPCSYSPEN